MGREQENNTYFTGLQGESKSILVSKILCTDYGNVWNEYYYIRGFHKISVFESSLEIK